jgi:hypothetical protein
MLRAMNAVDVFERVVCRPDTRALYESHYLKANAPGGDGNQGAVWIKYCLLAPTAPGVPAMGEFWAVVWDRPGAAPLVVKEVHPFEELGLGDGPRIDRGPLHLDPSRARGELSSGGHRVRWDLALSEAAAPLVHFPHPRLYTAKLPKKKILTPAPRLRFDGEIEIDGRVVRVERWSGIRGHNWGSEHAYAYAYGNCNIWEDPAEDLVLDGFTVKVRLGPIKSPWLSLAVGRSRGQELAWNRPRGWLARSARVDFPRWTLSLDEGGRSLETRWDCNPGDLAGLRYFHPDGKISYCYNTKYARLDVAIKERGSVRRASSRAAELEFLFPEPLPGIPLHGNVSFPR